MDHFFDAKGIIEKKLYLDIRDITERIIDHTQGLHLRRFFRLKSRRSWIRDNVVSTA